MSPDAARTAVENPFKTLLHGLMTGRIRVKGLDVAEAQ